MKATTCSDRIKHKKWEQKKGTEWHGVVFFGKLAEIAEEYLSPQPPAVPRLA